MRLPCQPSVSSYINVKHQLCGGHEHYTSFTSPTVSFLYSPVTDLLTGDLISSSSSCFFYYHLLFLPFVVVVWLCKDVSLPPNSNWGNLFHKDWNVWSIWHFLSVCVLWIKYRFVQVIAFYFYLHFPQHTSWHLNGKTFFVRRCFCLCIAYTMKSWFLWSHAQHDTSQLCLSVHQ